MFFFSFSGSRKWLLLPVRGLHFMWLPCLPSQAKYMMTSSNALPALCAEMNRSRVNVKDVKEFYSRRENKVNENKVVSYCEALSYLARRHGHVFRMALHNEGDWRMETWQRARQGALSCLHTPIPELCNAILNTCQMPSRFYIIPSNGNKSQTHLLKPFIARDLMEGHICRQNTLMFALVFCLNCVHAPPALPSRCEKSYSWRQARSVKTAKKSWTVPQCGHVTLNCAQMASKQANVEFSSYIFF